MSSIKLIQNSKKDLVYIILCMYVHKLFSVVCISFSQVSGSVFEDLIESRSKLNVSNIAKVSFIL